MIMSDMYPAIFIYFVVSFLLCLAHGADAHPIFSKMSLKDEDSNTISVYSVIVFSWNLFWNSFKAVLLMGGFIISMLFIGLVFLFEKLKDLKVYKYKS